MNYTGTDISYQDFAADLFLSFDLDPLYPAILRADMGDNKLKRWVLAYMCYYHAGVASWLAEQPDFYGALWDGLTQLPRGLTRRHFRGKVAAECVLYLKNCGEPERIIDTMTIHKDFRSLSKAVKSFPQFSTWAAWKMADYADRVFGIPLDMQGFTPLDLPKDPIKGAALVYHGDRHHPVKVAEVQAVLDESIAMFKDFKAPPFLDRPVDVLEVETVLCKWKAHHTGHYPLGFDSFDLTKELQGWGDLAQQVYLSMRDSVSYLI